MLLAAGALGGCAGVAAGRVELHPDCQFFFAEDSAGELDQLVDLVADEGPPEFADELQLIAQRSRRAQGRKAQQVKKADGLCIGYGNQRAAGEVDRELRSHLAIDGLLLEGFFLEKFFEGLEGLVAVGGPEQHQFFKRGGFVGRACGFGLEPLFGSVLAADDG